MTKTILYGAFGRYNFGDLLFPHIVSKLLNDNKVETDIEYCDILSRDMSCYGGHNTRSISDFLDCEDPINVIHVGGQTGGCKLNDAIQMFNDSSQESEIAKLKKISDPIYLLSKSDFQNPNKFILNSAGGYSDAGSEKIKHYDYASFRDKDSLLLNENKIQKKLIHSIDSAILTKRFFGDHISLRSKEKHIQDIKKSVGVNYIAVQINSGFVFDNQNEIKELLTRLVLDIKLPIVLFAAGTAPEHDSFYLYNELSKHLKGFVHICKTQICWDVCNIISNAKFVIGTSLHVRILAAQYFRPRLTFFSRSKALREKHIGFIKDWDCIDNCDININNAIPYISEGLKNHDEELDQKQLRLLEENYLDKSTWINLLK